uniref:GPN-loop GTPase 3 n=1 Tax=Guillardia theta TaxID=55529 RepID=A0A7S4JBK5_GUITH
MYEHGLASKRSFQIVNLDPAAEHFKYPVTVDVRELISLDDVMEELDYGPNGGLVYAFEYLDENLEWLREQLGDSDDDYFIMDCPGQIELYSHVPVMKNLVQALQRWGFMVCGVYVIDSQFIADPGKFISGCLACLSAMVQLEIPHVNVLTKMDLVRKKRSFMEKFYQPDIDELIADLNADSNPAMYKLNQAMGSLLDDYSLVGFLPLNIYDPDSVIFVLSHIDNAIQYGEDREPAEPEEYEVPDE